MPCSRASTSDSASSARYLARRPWCRASAWRSVRPSAAGSSTPSAATRGCTSDPPRSAWAPWRSRSPSHRSPRRRELCRRLRHSKETPLAYVDGFVLPVPKKKLAAYRRMARKAGKVWMEYGALQFRECVADDVKPGKPTSFPRSVKLKPGETVFFSYIVYKSRRDRDRINKKVMSDKRITGSMDAKSMPFDARRMIYGGFKTLVDL